jgi:hypothetical protein
MVTIFFSLLNFAIAEPNQLCAQNGQTISEEDIYKVAIIGNTRPLNLRKDPAALRVGSSEGVTQTLLSNIVEKDPDCVSFVGDMVRSGSKKEWKKFQSEQLGSISNIPVMPVVGDTEAIRDGKYSNFNTTFPNVGDNIGYNRVGSWYYYDVETDGTTWRFMVLDANKSVLKSRWNEQLAWIDDSVQGDYEGLFIFMHSPWYNLAGASPEMNPQNNPRELIEYVEDSLGMMKLRAVFFAGGHANQAITPNGNYGSLYVGVGGGGAPAEDLYLWQPGTMAGVKGRVELESVYRDALLNQFDRWNSRNSLSPAAMDKAFNKGSYEGFPGLIDGSEFPVQGFWELKLKGKQSVIVYHHYLPNGTILKMYKMDYTDKEGWVGTKL